MRFQRLKDEMIVFSPLKSRVFIFFAAKIKHEILNVANYHYYAAK